jgi:hypothetical protein
MSAPDNSISIVGIILIVLGMALSMPAQSQNNVLTQHYDQNRSGWYRQETRLTNRNIKYPGFGRIFTRAVDDQIYAQPLIVNVNLPSGNKNIVVIATVNNSVYAFDADSANVTQPYWQVNLTPAGNRVIQNTDMTGACGGGYRDFSGNMGIVGTPVIDPGTNTLYVVSRNVNPTTLVFQQFLHAINILSGAENSGSPVLIAASVSGSGDGGSTVSFDPQKNNQRPGLLLLNGIVYIAWSSHCDWTPYHGWIIGYDATTLQRKFTYCTTPDGYEGGVWMSGAGLAADTAGNIYAAVGNGSVGKNGDYTNLRNRSESALKLTPSGSGLNIDSYFSPSNIAELEAGDLDFGVTEILLIPNTNQAIVGCKDGNLYLLNRDNMGGYNATFNNVIQNIDLGTNAHLHSSLGYYRGSQNEYVYTWSENSILKALSYDRTANQFNLGSTINSGVQGPIGNNGAVMSVSSNASIDSTAVLWASHAANGDANQSVRPGILRALDANDVTKELWNSSQYLDDNPGNYAKFNCPVIANGKVYLGTFSNQLVVYGLKKVRDVSCPSANLGLNKASTSSSGTASNAFDGDITTQWISSSSDAQSISVDLGQRYDLCGITLKWGAKYGVNYILEYSDDNTNWSSLLTITGNSSATNSYFVSGTGQFVRLQGILGETGYILNEFEITGSLSSIQCATPFVLPVTNIYENSATLNWAASGNSFLVQYKTPSAGSWAQVTTAYDSISLSGLACATDYLFRVRKICGTDSSSFSVSGAFSTLPCNENCDPLPTRWISLDIGDVNTAGSACYLDGVFTIMGSGNDIWGNADEFRFAYKTYTGDGDYYIRVATMDNSDPWNKCGIMFRESLAEGSRHVFVAITSGNGVAFQNRLQTDDVSYNVNTGAGIKAPYWVKIAKQGSVYTAYSSPDGLLWTQVGTPVDAGFGNGIPVYAGLALTSHNNGVLSTATLDNLYISGSFEYDLQNFTANLNLDKTVALDWVTTVESNLEKFTVERSSDNITFTDIETLAAANQGHYTQEYSTVDNHPAKGLNYYKLRMMTVVGIVKYSALVSVWISTAVSPSVYPNPVSHVPGDSGPLIAYVAGGDEEVKFINVYDFAGRLAIQITNTSTTNLTEIPVSSLSNGIYIVEIKTAHSTYRDRLTVLN